MLTSEATSIETGKHKKRDKLYDIWNEIKCHQKSFGHIDNMEMKVIKFCIDLMKIDSTRPVSPILLYFAIVNGSGSIIVYKF